MENRKNKLLSTGVLKNSPCIGWVLYLNWLWWSFVMLGKNYSVFIGGGLFWN